MSFSLLPIEIKDHIISFIQPTKITNQEVKNFALEIKNISLVDREINVICQEKLMNLKKIYDLINTYSAYNSDYENWHKDSKASPQLLDALFSGCTLPYAKCTFNYYDSSREEDIKEIVKLIPQSIDCDLGYLRCRHKITPLFAACINKKIPILIIEFLLKHGANPNATVLKNGKPIHMLKDLEENMGYDDRFSEIKKLFKEYGANIQDNNNA